MATYDSIKFDIDRARQVILDECDSVMKNAINQHMGSLEYPGTLYGPDREVTSLEYEVVFEDVRAWVMFFGRGQGITHENPYLDEYMSNEKLWADGRPRSGTVVRRGSGPYSQYDYKTGELKHYESGTEPQGEALKPWQQKMLRIDPKVNFWDTIEKIYNTFLEGFNNIALPNIQRRFTTECFTIEHKTI